MSRHTHCSDILTYQTTQGGSSNSYTLLLVDPDAPTPEDPKFAFWRHWVLPGLTAKGEQTKPALTEYLGPGAKDET